MPYHQRRVRCYEFGYIVPWNKIVADIGSNSEGEKMTDLLTLAISLTVSAVVSAAVSYWYAGWRLARL